MKEEKKKIVLTIITVITLIVMVGGSAYAYFEAQTDAGAITNINVQAKTTDSLKFETGQDLSMVATQESFGVGKGNLKSSTTATATLIANNQTNTASNNYYVYLDITENTFLYTQNSDTAELLLKVTGPNGEVMNLDGLERATSGGETGFDITNFEGLITIASNTAIEVTESTLNNTTNHEWRVEVILVNLDANQNENAGKTFNAKLLIQKEEIVTLANYILSTYEGDDTLYHHDNTLENGAGDNSYRYAGGNYEQSNLVKSKCTTGEDTCTTYNTVYYLEYDTNQTSYSSLDEAYIQGLKDGYIKEKVKNYVCFGSDENECPEDNLYRIIGVFDNQIKLVKNNAVSSGTWQSDDETNDWEKSSINDYINQSFLKSFSEEWQNKISLHNWSVGGTSIATGKIAKEHLDIEMNNDKLYSAKIGLLYANEYGFASNSDNWGKSMNTTNTNEFKENWLYKTNKITKYSYKTYDNFYIPYLISINKDNNNNILGIKSGQIVTRSVIKSGITEISSCSATSSVRYCNEDNYITLPTFYLNENVTITSGNGTYLNPYRIA